MGAGAFGSAQSRATRSQRRRHTSEYWLGVLQARRLRARNNAFEIRFARTTRVPSTSIPSGTLLFFHQSLFRCCANVEAAVAARIVQHEFSLCAWSGST